MAFPQELKYSRYQATFEIVVYYPANGTNFPEKQDKLEYTAEHQLLSISVASNVPGYEEPQCFVAEEGREAALQTVAAFVKHLEIIAEQASGLERQRFASLLSRLEKSWDLSYQPPPPLPSPASVFEQEESGESASFDEDSDDDEESEEDDDNEETEEDRSFIDEDDLEEENDLSFYRRVHLQLPERRPVALPAAPAQAMSRLLKKETTVYRLASPPHRTDRGGFQLEQIRSERAERYPDSLLGPSLVHRSGHQAPPRLPGPPNRQPQVSEHLQLCGGRHQLLRLPTKPISVRGRKGSSLTSMCCRSVRWRDFDCHRERPSILG